MQKKQRVVSRDKYNVMSIHYDFDTFNEEFNTNAERIVKSINTNKINLLNDKKSFYTIEIIHEAGMVYTFKKMVLNITDQFEKIEKQTEFQWTFENDNYTVFKCKDTISFHDNDGLMSIEFPCNKCTVTITKRFVDDEY